VFNGGFFAQCRAAPQQGAEFCGQHTGVGKMKHGRYDNPIDPAIAALGEAFLNRKRRATRIDKRWYSRVRMLEEAVVCNVQCGRSH